MAYIGLVSGKGDFVRRKNPESRLVENVCLCTYNADFSVGGCMAQVPGELVDDVIRMNGSYGRTKAEVKKNIQEYRARGLDLDKRCDYCYAKGTGRGNWGKTTAREINGRTREYFEKFKPEFVRIGKSTECGHFMYIPVLKQFLELCNEFDTKVIFPNKMLSFDSEIARLFRKNHGLLSYSMGYDDSETGAISQGYTNEWRIKQANLYFRAGVNCVLSCAVDVTQSIQDNAHFGNSIGEAIKDHEKIGIPLRIIPLRLPSKEFAMKVTGKKWEDLVMPSDYKPDHPELELELEGRWRFTLKGNHEAVPLFLHGDFQRLYDSGIGFCGRVGDYEYCDKCCLLDERVKFPITELIPVVYERDNLNRNDRRRANNRKKKDDSPRFI